MLLCSSLLALTSIQSACSSQARTLGVIFAQVLKAKQSCSQGSHCTVPQCSYRHEWRFPLKYFCAARLQLQVLAAFHFPFSNSCGICSYQHYHIKLFLYVWFHLAILKSQRAPLLPPLRTLFYRILKKTKTNSPKIPQQQELFQPSSHTYIQHPFSLTTSVLEDGTQFLALKEGECYGPNLTSYFSRYIRT